MMATTGTRPVVHQPWCENHVDDDLEENIPGWCSAVKRVNGVSVEILSDTARLSGQTGVEIYGGNPDNPLTSAQLREVAAALIEAAEIVEQAAK